MSLESYKTLTEDINRRTINTAVKSLHCKSSYAPVDNGWLKYKGNLAKKIGDTYQYV